MVFGPRKWGLKVFNSIDFQFPVGIRWCSDVKEQASWLVQSKISFNSLWELDGVRT